MRKHINVVGIIALAALSLLHTSCPDPTTIPSGPYITLTLNQAVNVSDLNGTAIYTIISYAPSSKPESNDPPSSTYLYSLTTSAYSASSIAPSKEQPHAGIYSDAQIQMDLLVREMENSLLSSKIPQASKTTGIDRAAPSPITIDTTWTDVYIAATGVTINTTCKAISDHAFFFIDDRDSASMASYLAGYCTSFDAIYDVNHTHFGTENDTDGNGKVIIIFSRELSSGLLGYFYPGDKYPKTTFPISNEGDIFYITTDSGYQGNVVNATLAHEFQHMIYFDKHYNQGVVGTYSWLNEALSQAAEYYNDYLDNHLGWISNFLNDHYFGLSLTHWTDANYGYGAIWIRYVQDHFGDDAIKDMCSTGLIGIDAVEAATGMNFNTLFNNFLRALVMDGTGDPAPIEYSFISLDLPSLQNSAGRPGLDTDESYPAGTSWTYDIYPYQINFFGWMDSFGTMKLSGTGFKGTTFGLLQ